MSEGAYAQVGEKLFALGYACLPVMPNTKIPGEKRHDEWGGLSNWNSKYTHRLPSRFERQLWSASEAGICVICGPASKYLIGVDIDSDEPAIRNAIIAALPDTTLIKRGAKGETRFYRGPDIEKSKSWNLPHPDRRKDDKGKVVTYRVCDIIGPGRQTLLPPTVHPDTGRPYVWLEHDTLAETDPESLPLLTPEHIEAISAALVQFGYETEPERPKLGPVVNGGSIDHERPIHRQLNDAALANFDAWVPLLPAVMRVKKRSQGYEAVAVWRASNSGQAIAKRKLNLKFDRSGIVDFGDGPRNYTALNVVMAAFGTDLDTAYMWLADALGWNDRPIIDLKPRQSDEKPQAEARGVEVDNPDERLDENAPRKVDDYAEKIERLTRCPGLLGDIIDWIEATARRPNRVLALGTAITVMGTLMGRRIAGPTNSATHLYAIGLAPTTSGKQHPIDCLNRLMAAANAQAHIGPSEFISMSAVVNMVLRQPLSVSAQDEFGAFLKRVNNRRASTQEQNISKVLRSLWGISFNYFAMPEWAGRASTLVPAPALSIYGLSTPGEFFDGLQSSELKNGFLNRCLVLTADRGESVEEPKDSTIVPSEIANGLGEIFRWGGAPESLSTSRLNDATMLPTAIKLKWANDEAKACFRELQRHIDSRLIENENAEYYLGRTAEIAIRLATIRAVGRWGPSNGGPTVDRSDVEWARDLALTCGERLAEDASTFIADNERQAWSNRIRDIIRRKGTATLRDIQRSLAGALKNAEIKDHLESLTEGGFVECLKVEMKNGRLGKEYKYRG